MDFASLIISALSTIAAAFAAYFSYKSCKTAKDSLDHQRSNDAIQKLDSTKQRISERSHNGS